MTTDIPPGSILVAVDGSADAERALRWAADAAQLEGRPLAAVAVGVEMTTLAVWAGAGAGAALTAPMTARLADTGTVVSDAVALVHRIAPDVDVWGAARYGDPRDVLTELSADAHLLVTGSRGHGAVMSTLLGSVAAAVAKRATCPVVVCRPRPQGVDGRGVVVAVDDPAGDRRPLEFGFDQASRRGLPLTVAHCLDVADVSSGKLDLAGERHRLTDAVLPLSARFPDVAVDIQIAAGPVCEQLTSDSEHWDLLVVGRRGAPDAGGHLGRRISTKVLEASHTTVAVVPETTDGRP